MALAPSLLMNGARGTAWVRPSSAALFGLALALPRGPRLIGWDEGAC